MSINDQYPSSGIPKARWPDVVQELVAKDKGAGSADTIIKLLCFLKDGNWPGSRAASDYLLSLGEIVIPHVDVILGGTDYGWKYWVLNGLVSQWPRVHVERIAPRLKDIAMHSDNAEANISAARVLIENELLPPDEAAEMLSRIREWLPNLNWEVDELEARLKPR